jgi:hypothetical protein
MPFIFSLKGACAFLKMHFLFSEQRLLFSQAHALITLVTQLEAHAPLGN